MNEPNNSIGAVEFRKFAEKCFKMIINYQMDKVPSEKDKNINLKIKKLIFLTNAPKMFFPPTF
jgi:hypothetical protein